MFFKALQTAAFVSLSFISATSLAENDFYVAPFGNYLHPGGDTRAFDGFGAGMALGKELGEHLNVEIRGFWQKYDNDYSCCKVAKVHLQGDSELTGGTLDLQWFFFRDQFSPYVVAAVGGLSTTYKMQTIVAGKSVNYEKDTSSFIFESGVGATYAVTDSVSLRSDIRYRLNTLPSSADDNGFFNDLTVNFGFVVPFR